MAHPVVPIVWTKLRPPVLPAHVIERVALHAQLVAVDAASLTAIVAPAGYGKTTAAAQLALRGSGAVAWVGLEPADDDPIRFWSYVVAALDSAGVAGAADACAHLARGVDGVDDAASALWAASLSTVST